MSNNKTPLTFVVSGFDQWTAVVDHCVRLIQPKTVFLLDGNLGAGKTTLVSLIVKKMGFQGDVSSPTYALTQTYAVDHSLTIQHVDLYRLETADEIMASGFWDLFSQDQHVLFVEWSSRIHQSDWPLDWTTYRLTIDRIEESKRIVNVEVINLL